MKKNSGLIAQHSALCWGEAMARILYLFLTIAMVVAWAIAEAQQPGKIFRIGRLDVSTASGSAVLWDAFRKELSSLGWTEGKNVTFEYRFAEQRFERLPELAAELV